MRFRHANSSARGESCRSALTLLEMMVAVTLLALIMVGLLAMFNQTQKALHAVNTQTDVFENARGAIQMIARDMTEMALFDNPIAIQDCRANREIPPSCHGKMLPSPIPSGSLPRPLPPPDDLLPVFFSEAYWLTRRNDDWQGVGYFVTDDPVQRTNYGVGTLYRFSGTTRRDQVPWLWREYYCTMQPTNTHRVSDGIVHFTVSAVSIETKGPPLRTNVVRRTSFDFTNSLPAFVDVEIGVLEPDALKQFESLQGLDRTVAQKFLRDHAGQIHFFRERVPIRNYVNPYRANEVP